MNKNIIAEGTTMGTTTHNHKEHTTANAPFHSAFFQSLHKEQWQEVRLGEVTKTANTGLDAIKRAPIVNYRTSLKCLRIQDISQNKCYQDWGFTEVSQQDFFKFQLKKKDILIARTGASVGVKKIIEEDLQAVFNNGLIRIRTSEKIKSKFLYYILSTSKYDGFIEGISGGTSTQPNIQIQSLLDFNFPLPPLKVQQQIAEILSSFDDKIDLLHRQNKTLESLALTLFRHTFMDNPNRNEWEEKPLSEIADFLNGLACQKIPPKNEIDRLPVLKIKELREGITESSDWATSEVDSKYIVQNGDIIFSWSASLMVKIWNGQKCILNQHLFKITSAIYPKWFYYFWCLYHLQEFVSIASAQATTMGHIKRQDLDNAICLIPDNQTLHELDKVISPLLLKINNNSQQIQNLQSMRDMLLAKILT